MPERADDLEEKLARIAIATAKLRPSQGFAERVRSAIRAEREALIRRAFLRAGRFVVATAAALAVATTVAAFELRSEADKATAISYGVDGVEELAW